MADEKTNRTAMQDGSNTAQELFHQLRTIANETGSASYFWIGFLSFLTGSIAGHVGHETVAKIMVEIQRIALVTCKSKGSA